MKSIKPKFSDRTMKGVREFLDQAHANRGEIEKMGHMPVPTPKPRKDEMVVPTDAEYKALKAIKGKLSPSQLKAMQAHPDMAGPTLTMRQKFTRPAALRKAAETLANEKPNHVMLPLPAGIKPLSAMYQALIPQGLSPQAHRVYEIILRTVAAREAGAVVNHKFHLGDFGKDLDDNVCTPLNKELSRTGVKTWEGNVAVLGEDYEEVDARAALSEAVVQELDMAAHAWVVPGTLGSSEDHRAHVTEGNTYGHLNLRPVSGKGIAEARPGYHKMRESMQRAVDGGYKLDVEVTCSLRDINELLQTPEDKALFKQAIASVHIQGGVKVEDGKLAPDYAAANNRFDEKAAAEFYKAVQELGIPTRTLDKGAAYSAQFDLSLFDTMARTGHPVGKYLAEYQKVRGDYFIGDAHGRRGFAPYVPIMDMKWASKNLFPKFVEMHGPDIAWPDAETTYDEGNREAAPYLKVLLYDALTTLFNADDATLKNLGIGTPRVILETNGAKHEVISGQDIHVENLKVVVYALLQGSIRQSEGTVK